MKILKYGSIIIAALLAAAIGFTSCGNSGGTLASITVTPADPTIATGTKKQFTALATFSDGTVIDWTTAAAWTTSNPEVTIGNSFGSYGLAASLATATTVTFTIKATDTINNISGTTTLYVTDPQSIAVTPANPYMSVGKTHQFKATATLPDLSTGGTTTTTQDLTTYATWTTTSGGVATVSDTTGSKGRLVSIAPGTTDIRADIMTSLSTTVPGSTTLTVTGTSLASITIAPDPAGPITVGSPLQFAATGNYPTGSPPTQDFTNSVIWRSSKTSVATIDNTGLATAVAVGKTTIKATDPITGISKSITLSIQ